MSTSSNCSASPSAVRISTLQYAWDFAKGKLWRTSYDVSDEEYFAGRVAIVTGANKGLGKAIVTELAKRSAKVVLACRDPAKGERAKADIFAKTGNENLEVYRLDLADYDSVRCFCKIVSEKHPEIHLLIHNAGMILESDPGATTSLGHNLIMTANYFSPVLLTSLLMDNLNNAQTSRIVFVADGLLQCGKLDVEDLQMSRVIEWGFRGSLSYCNSKLALAYYSKQLGARLQVENSHSSTYALCPGLVLTDTAPPEWCFNSLFDRVFSTCFSYTAEQAAETVLFCALAKTRKRETGCIYRNCSQSALLEQSLQDEILAEKLWVKTQEILKPQLSVSN